MDLDCDLLVLAAHRMELRGLSQRLGEGLTGVVSGRRVACAEVGVGLVAASAGTQRVLSVARTRAVILVGSYGYYPHVEGALCELSPLSEARLTDAQVLQGGMALPDAVTQRVTFDTAITAGLAAVPPALPPAVMATTLGITESDALAQLLGERSGCRGENMEAFAVGQVARQMGGRCAALLGATNAVGSLGRTQWRAHHGAVAEATAELICRWLSEGAPGLL